MSISKGYSNCTVLCIKKLYLCTTDNICENLTLIDDKTDYLCLLQ